MKINFKLIKTVLFGISLFFNFVFIFLLFMSSLSKTSQFSYYYPDKGYITAAAVASVPGNASASFGVIEINIKPGETAFIQFSVVSSGKQGNLLVNALYDPDIISVAQTGYGIVITARSEGSTLMQTFTNDGIKNLAHITVTK
jgi:hypothetical protein